MTVPHAVALAVSGRTRDGAEVAAFVLGHGCDPVRELGHAGWSVERFDAVEIDGEGLVLVFEVRPGTAAVCGGEAGGEPGALKREATSGVAGDPVVPTDPGLVIEEGERAEPYQRTAAYGVVTSERGVLLTELSALTSAPGRWTLPGGGLDPGETPEQALHREVWEESGQVISEIRLLDLHTSHWVGRAPNGRLEDFHAVRIVYAARCPGPTDPVVHDVGGSTASVRWVRPADLGRYRLTRSFAPHLRRWVED
jgi:8-oxo-dGTP pyrophosphatase MutT (NUDIX family)